MKNRRLFVALILLAAGCGGGGGGNDSSAPPAARSDGVARIDVAMQEVMRRRYSPPGIAVAVVRQGKLVFADAYGSADLAIRTTAD